MKYLPTLYAAYGSNLNKEQMSRRCPNAQPAGSMSLDGFVLKFRGVADIQKSMGDSVEVGLWNITEDCLKQLDIYEGYPHLYKRDHVAIKDGLPVMAYIMNRQTHVYPPAPHYLDAIARGFADFNLDSEYLKQALKDSYANETVEYAVI